MKPTQTGIAVALALAVVVLIYVLPGLWPLGGPAAAVPTEDTTSAALTQQPTSSTTMTNESITELQITDEVVGTGATAGAGDNVTVQYVGSLVNGTVFDASANHGSQGLTFTLGAGQVIKGWDQGILGMKEGGKRRLAIPADLAYGSRAIGNLIPANSALIFEVELLKVEKGR